LSKMTSSARLIAMMYFISTTTGILALASVSNSLPTDQSGVLQVANGNLTLEKLEDENRELRQKLSELEEKMSAMQRETAVDKLEIQQRVQFTEDHLLEIRQQVQSTEERLMNDTREAKDRLMEMQEQMRSTEERLTNVTRGAYETNSKKYDDLINRLAHSASSYPSATCSSYSTQIDDGVDQPIAFLNRHDIRCPEGRFFDPVSASTGSTKVRYKS